MPDSSPIVILTGKQRIGKTTTCNRIAQEARDGGWDVAGITCPAIFEQTQKTAIDVLDLRSGQLKRFATRLERPLSNGLIYKFEDQTLEWANRRLEAACPCELLMIDEIGPLELEQGRGLLSAMPVLRGGNYRIAVVVVRPTLIPAFKAQLAMPCQVMEVAELINLSALTVAAR